MKNPKGIRQQAEAVLELSNAILAAAIKGRRETMDELVSRRADLIEQMFSAGEACGDSRAFLSGVMKQVRTLDTATREYLDWDRCGGISTPDGELEMAWFEADPQRLEGRLPVPWPRCPAA